MDAYNIQIKKDKSYLLIYALLVIAQSILTNTETAPPTYLRLLYWAFAFIPVIQRPGWMSGVFVMLYTLSGYGFAYGYMPYDNYWYILFAATPLFFNKVNKTNVYKIPRILYALMAYTFVIELITSQSISSISSIVLLVILLMSITEKNDTGAIKRMSIGFAIASLVLSILFILFGSMFATNYSDVFERRGWTDPNYFGMVISFGTITSLFEIVRKKYSYNWEKYLYFATILITIPTLILNGSRGALLAFVVSGAVILLFSKTKSFYKVLYLLLGIGFVIFLYTSTSIFEFLLYRIQNDELGGGSGRVEIWGIKIREFLQCDIIHIIFGLGSDKGLELGWNQSAVSFAGKMGFHSDYVSYFVKYGIIGFIMFIRILATPFSGLSKKQKKYPFVLSGMAAIALYAFSLEPFSSGGTAYWLFYMYMLMISLNKHYIS